MTDRLMFRDAITSAVHGAFSNRTDCQVLFENGAHVDMNSSTLPVIACEIVYQSSEQADLSENPYIKDEGEILITVLVKDMTGNRLAYRLRDEAAYLLQRRPIAGAVTKVARILPNSDAVKGWVGYRTAVPFFHYHL